MNKVITGFMAILVLGAGIFFSGCKTASVPGRSMNPTLYVGITPDCPPIIFKKDGQILGLEADLAHEMAKALDRPLLFVEVPWEQQINLLMADKFDVIMSGMTITRERQVRIDFCEPHLQQGQMALVRRTDLDRFGTSSQICNANANFAVQRKTTGDIFVQQVCRNAASVGNLAPADAAQAICCKMIDIYIHDAPVIIWMASENEADLTTVPIQTPTQSIAWGVKKTDVELRDTLNKVLAQWKQDGTLDRIRQRWLPGDMGK
ncbi:MAG: transporter substrate-binding domain-containing protein [Kiritimatiellae bacterium]|nr:transporter substrate-binding domain-containing protein [Kiritimatiellia bacterium]